MIFRFRIVPALLTLLTLSLTSLTSCANQQTLPSSNYKTQLSYPEQTDELVFMEQDQSDNPLFGTRLSYQSRFYELDIFNVFIYPIRQLNWQNQKSILMDEAVLAYQNLDELVKEKGYQSRSLEDIDEISFEFEQQKYQGLRGKSRIHLHDELYMHNYVYFFVQQDKIIRFSANMKFAEQLPAPDDYIKGLLAKLKVPKESAYMADLRKSVSRSKS